MIGFGNCHGTICSLLFLHFLSFFLSLQESHALSIFATTTKWPSSRYSKEAHVAATLVSHAVQLCQTIQPRDTTYKDDGTPVTVLDYAIQAYISARLQQEFPTDQLWAEEDLSTLSQQDPSMVEGMASLHKIILQKNCPDHSDMDSISLSPLPLLLPSTPPSATTIPNETTDNNPQQQRQQRVWILDPIDGTQGLLTNQEYAVGLALRNEQGELVVGVLGNPARTHAVMVAVQNEGIRFWNPNDNDNNDENGTWIQLEETQEDDDEQKHNSKSYKNWIQYQENYQLDGVQSTNNADTTSHPTTTTTTFWNHSPGTRVGIDYPPYLMSRPNTMGSPMPFGPHCPPVHLCCGSLVKYFAVARGEVAGFIQHQHDHLNSWDHAAGILCVQEAGGSVQDGQGQAIQIRAKQFEVTRGIVACASSASQPVRYHLQASLQWE